MVGDLNGALGGRIRACAINDKQSDSACNNLKVQIRPYNRF